MTTYVFQGDHPEVADSGRIVAIGDLITPDPDSARESEWLAAGWLVPEEFLSAPAKPARTAKASRPNKTEDDA